MWMFRTRRIIQSSWPDMFGDIVATFTGLVGRPWLHASAIWRLTTPSSAHSRLHAEVSPAHKVDPIGILLTTKLMLDSLKETERADGLERHRPRHRRRQSATSDMGGKNTTLEVAQAIADYASS